MRLVDIGSPLAFTDNGNQEYKERDLMCQRKFVGTKRPAECSEVLGACSGKDTTNMPCAVWTIRLPIIDCHCPFVISIVLVKEVWKTCSRVIVTWLASGMSVYVICKVLL